MDFTTRTGLGTAPLGSSPGGPLWWGPQELATSVATVEAAIESGVGWIDTAPFYGWGLAEQIVGRAMRSASRRVAVLTKCGTQQGPDGMPYEDASPAMVRRGVYESLERLQVDFVDVVQVHDPDPATPIEDTWMELLTLVDEGVIGGAGLSNHSVDLMDRAIAVGPIAVVQHQYSLLHRIPETDGTLTWCGAHGESSSWPGRHWRRGSSPTVSISTTWPLTTCVEVFPGQRRWNGSVSIESSRLSAPSPNGTAQR